MAQWNEYLPEWRRVCYNSDVHYMTYRPTSRDGSNFIYKLPDSDPTNLATNYYWWNGSGYLLESDININYNQPWDNGAVVGAYDVRSVFLHEIGHTVGLGHSLVQEAVMFRTFPTNWVRTTFSYDDLNGLAARYEGVNLYAYSGENRKEKTQRAIDFPVWHGDLLGELLRMRGAGSVK